MSKVVLGMPSEDRIATLLNNGFSPKTYDQKQGEFLVKSAVIDDMAYAGGQLIDGDYITSGMVAITEICPDGQVQLHIPEAEYLENYPLDTEEGVALINDALTAPILNVPVIS